MIIQTVENVSNIEIELNNINQIIFKWTSYQILNSIDIYGT